MHISATCHGSAFPFLFQHGKPGPLGQDSLLVICAIVPRILPVMLNQHFVDQVRRKRLIFTVTSGRSGTAFLSSIFGYVRKVHSFHEPSPEFVKVLRRVQREPDLARRFLLEEKLPAIAKDNARIYVETSHLACKGFLEPLLEMNVIPDLIIHRRPPRDVSLSLYRMGTIPGRTEKAFRFYLSPDDPDVLYLDNWPELHDYQLCYWYCLEMERRAKKYSQMFREHGARIAETTLQGLRTIEGLEQLMLDLELTLKWPVWLTQKRFYRNTGVKVNESKETKRDRGLPDSADELEAGVLERLDCSQLVRWLPDLNRQIIG